MTRAVLNSSCIVKLTSRLRTVKVGIQSLPTHLGNLLTVTRGDVVQESLQVRLGMQGLELLLLHTHPLVQSPLVSELFVEKKRRKTEITFRETNTTDQVNTPLLPSHFPRHASVNPCS